MHMQHMGKSNGNEDGKTKQRENQKEEKSARDINNYVNFK